MTCASDIGNLRKAGDLENALARSRECFAQTPDDLYVQQAYGWVIHALLKRYIADVESNRCSFPQIARQFSDRVAEYRQFGENHRPGLLHSQILGQVLKVSRKWFEFLEFARWWGPQFLTDEDKKPYVAPDGKTVPSLALRFYYAIGREAVDQAQRQNSDTSAWGEEQLVKALTEYPDDLWLNYYWSKLLLDRGDVAQARSHLMPVVHRNRNTAWVWSLLGQTFEAESPDKAITCYYYAIQVAGRPQDVVNIRASLARLLVSQERYLDATLQVLRAVECRQISGYKVSNDLRQLIDSDWYQRYSSRTDLPAEPDATKAAKQIIDEMEANQIRYRLGVVDGQNPAKFLVHVAFGPDDGAVLYYKDFDGIANLPVGTMIEVGFIQGDKRARRWQASTTKQIDGFCLTMTGRVSQVPGQSYGFLTTGKGERVFVPPLLMDSTLINVSTTLGCIAVMSQDKRGKPGWRVIAWLLD